MKQGNQSWCSVTTERDRVLRKVGGEFRMGGHMYTYTSYWCMAKKSQIIVQFLLQSNYPPIKKQKQKQKNKEQLDIGCKCCSCHIAYKSVLFFDSFCSPPSSWLIFPSCVPSTYLSTLQTSWSLPPSCVHFSSVTPLSSNHSPKSWFYHLSFLSFLNCLSLVSLVAF